MVTVVDRRRDSGNMVLVIAREGLGLYHLATWNICEKATTTAFEVAANVFESLTAAQIAW